MKNKMSKKLLSLVIAVVFCATTFVMTGASVDKVYAENDGYIPPSQMQMTYYPKWKSGNTEWYADDTDITIEMDSVTSTNPDVARLVYEPGEGGYSGYYYLKTKKPGKATLTFYGTLPGSGTSDQKTVKVTVYKWVKPCKTFKVGSKSYSKKFNKKSQYGTPKKISGKLVVKAKKGWKITYMSKYISKKDKVVNVKNKRKITLKKGDDLYVEFKKKGTQRYEYVLLYRY